MQQLRLHKRVYQVGRIDEEYSEKGYDRLRKLESFARLRSEGCSIASACSALEVAQATLYRWRRWYKQEQLAGLENESRRPKRLRTKTWSPCLVSTTRHLRTKNPLYGRYKLQVLLKRDHGVTASVSTVGRIISMLIAQRAIQPAHFYYAHTLKQPRRFTGHAKRLPKGMKATAPGELIQIDHMSVELRPGVQVKHFQAICPTTKMIYTYAYSRATSSCAADFLKRLIDQLPFPLVSLQVDGGSEFRKDFEATCKQLHLPLFVIPPRSPEDNGAVERANGAAKFEFYAFYSGAPSLFHIRKHLQRYVHKYNTYRPHQALQYLTPLQYYNLIAEA